MRIISVRRVSQIFFFILFVWFCIVSSLGLEWWRLRGWPVNWFLQLDPLVALATVLTTHTLYAGLAWALATIALTILLGRFFCGWVCPFGSLNHFIGFLGRRGKPRSFSIAVNQYHDGQKIKYYVLAFLLSASAGALLANISRTALGQPAIFLILFALSGLAVFLKASKSSSKSGKTAGMLLLLIGFWTTAAFFISLDRMIAASMQTGLLDPIPLIYRSVNLVVLPLIDTTTQKISASQRFYDGSFLIGLIFFSSLLLNLRIPRFYCRFVCPLGALYGLIGRYALWRVGNTRNECKDCNLCEANCEGSCEPAGSIRIHECVLCMNCLDDCRHDSIAYSTTPSASGEVLSPDISRRGALVTIFSGIAMIPVLRLNGSTALNWHPQIIRPPGALPEEEFLARCTKCGQCMRVCPTNIIQPANTESSIEGLWTPVLNFRIGSSGCQSNCIACGHICPTAAIRPLSLDEKLGRNAYKEAGPVRIGTAFVDHGRCLPWAMDKPCIVCQENCPVSPKAIFVREQFIAVRDARFTIKNIEGSAIEIEQAALSPGRFATGDYFLRIDTHDETDRRRIRENTERIITVETNKLWTSPLRVGISVEVEVRLLRPQVDLERCTGCGVCEHECPVSGKRAIRVTAENESRSRKHSLLL